MNKFEYDAGFYSFLDHTPFDKNASEDWKTGWRKAYANRKLNYARHTDVEIASEELIFTEGDHNKENYYPNYLSRIINGKSSV